MTSPSTPTTLMYRPSDFDAAVVVLRDVFEFDLVSAWDDDGRGAIFAVGTARLELFWDADPGAMATQRPHRPVAAAGALPVSIGWEVPDVDAAVDGWERSGATVRSRAADTPWGTRMAVVSGPDGITLCPFSVCD